MARKYANLYERLVANTRLEREDDPSSCWLWTGTVCAGYPRITIRRPGGRPVSTSATRLMLEEFHDIWFPFDEAGHLCGNTLCVSPLHLEVETRALNLIMSRGMRIGAKLREACLIPTIFPRPDWAEEALEGWSPFEPFGVLDASPEAPF